MPQREVWEAIQDPDILADILPNCKSLTPCGDNSFDANIEIKIGPIKGHFESKLNLFDLDPPNGYKFDINGDVVPGSPSADGINRYKVEFDPATGVGQCDTSEVV